MLDFILNTLVYTLAFYGLFQIIRSIMYIMKYTNLSEDRYICNNCCKKSRKKNWPESYVQYYLK